MQLEFIKQNQSHSLTLLFAGWGMSAADFLFLEHYDTDVLVCSDYRTLNFQTEILKPYTDIRLIGYSLGVWAASYIFNETKIDFSIRTAINGTQFPISDECGIPVKIYETTESTLSETSFIKFLRRMCGSKENFQEFTARTGGKNIPQLKEELRTIQRLSMLVNVSAFRWDKALIGKNDAIFPPKNQYNAWNGNAEIEMRDAPHFAAHIFK